MTGRSGWRLVGIPLGHPREASDDMADDMKIAEAVVTKGMSDEEVEDLREAFSHFDANGDGSISHDELAVVLRSLGYSPSRDQLQQMMDKVRTNGRGCHAWSCHGLAA